MKRKRNRLQYRTEDLPSFLLMHVIFFLVQLIFFYIYFSPNENEYIVWNIPVLYYRIQQIGAPTLLVCSLIWMNRAFFPGEAKYLVISLVVFVLEWFGIDKLIVQT